MEEEKNRAIGLAIKSIRNENKITQKTLALRSGISSRSIWTLEKGLSTPSFLTVWSIAEAMGVSPEVLVTRATFLFYRGTNK